MMNFNQLQAAVVAAKKQFALMRKKFPKLKAYLVLSLPGGQAGIDSSPIQLLTDFPKLIFDGIGKRQALALLERAIKMEAGLKNLSSPETDVGLKSKAREVARLEDEFKSQFGTGIKTIAARRNQPVYEAKAYLKSLSQNQISGMAAGEMLEKMAAVETAKTDLKSLEEMKKAELMALQEQLSQQAATLKYDGQCQIELRFTELNYDLIWKLQADELVDRNLTPRTKASIRIVFGTLTHFGKPPTHPHHE